MTDIDLLDVTSQASFDVFDWAMTRAVFDRFVDSRMAPGEVSHQRVRRGGMDQLSVTAVVDGHEVQLVRDRGGVFVDVDGHSARTLVGFAAGVDPVALASESDPSPAFSLASWRMMTDSLSALPALERYEAAVANAVMRRIERVAAPVVASAA